MAVVDFDEILPKMGSFGRWQKLCVVLLWFPPLFAGVHNLLFVFTGLHLPVSSGQTPSTLISVVRTEAQ